ncbi:hypothetical protein SPI_05376 [Niveomyces insectorum RCEF 264]|uniref:Uncharacterized protein n=1 Tax=Niveomyces insectorum RCEF 264 TaxID=1081102 RepID=A0A167T5I6_9HYPO|nr:hypothetical protein SPI_05376 [Niveomyces insectorum RCEF 264]
MAVHAARRAKEATTDGTAPLSIDDVGGMPGQKRRPNHQARYTPVQLAPGELARRAQSGRCTYCSELGHARNRCALGRLMRKVPKAELDRRLCQSLCPLCGDPDRDRHNKTTCPQRHQLASALGPRRRQAPPAPKTARTEARNRTGSDDDGRKEAYAEAVTTTADDDIGDLMTFDEDEDDADRGDGFGEPPAGQARQGPCFGAAPSLLDVEDDMGFVNPLPHPPTTRNGKGSFASDTTFVRSHEEPDLDLIDFGTD